MQLVKAYGRDEIQVNGGTVYEKSTVIRSEHIISLLKKVI